MQTKPKMKASKRGRPKLSDKKVQVTFYVQPSKLCKFGCTINGARANNIEKLTDYLNQMIDLY